MSRFAELPIGWVETTLGDLMLKLQYGYTASASYEASGKRLLRITDIQNGAVDWNTVPGCEISDQDFEKYRLEDGDFVFARTGSIEKAWRVSDVPTAVFASYLIRGKLTLPDIAPWLEQFIHTLSYLIQIGAASAGIGRENVNAKKLAQIELPIPPLNEQRRIVAKIEALKARNQQVKEALEAIPPLLNQFRQSVLAAAFRGDLTADWREKNPDVEPASVLTERIRAERRRGWEEAELEKMKASGKTPKDDNWKAKYKEPTRLEEDVAVNCPDSWTWGRAEEVCDFITKGTTPVAEKMFEQGDIPFIKVYNLTNRGKLDFSINPTFISQDVHNGELARSKVFSGDVLMNIVGPPLGKVAIVPSDYEEWNMNQAIAVYRAMPGIDNCFLCYCLLSAEILSIAVNAAKATAGQFNLTLEICRDLPLPIPPTSEQQQIVAIVDHFFAAADLIREQVANALSENEVLNQSILAKAFRGELVPQDPNDEPASVLLERIRAERAKREAEAKTAKKSIGKTTGQRSRKAKQQNSESIQLGLPGLE